MQTNDEANLNILKVPSLNSRFEKVAMQKAEQETTEINIFRLLNCLSQIFNSKMEQVRIKRSIIKLDQLLLIQFFLKKGILTNIDGSIYISK